jgi:hypothetical protein
MTDKKPRKLLGHWIAEDDMPKIGWKYSNIFVMPPKGAVICGMCLAHHIQRIHVMKHPNHSGVLCVGYVCAAHMIDDDASAQKVERLFTSRITKKERLPTRKWYRYDDKIEFLKSDRFIIYTKRFDNGWGGRILSEDESYKREGNILYDRRIDAARAAFDVITDILQKELLAELG